MGALIVKRISVSPKQVASVHVTFSTEFGSRSSGAFVLLLFSGKVGACTTLISIISMQSVGAALGSKRPLLQRVFDRSSYRCQILFGNLCLCCLFIKLGFAGLENFREEPVRLPPSIENLVVNRIAQHVLDGRQ